MAHKIVAVEPGSIAEELGLRPGDGLISINGERVVDFVDYQALCASEKLTLIVERDGEGETEFVFEKDGFEPLGLSFDTDLMGGVRLCANKCVFCFVDQLPVCARDSLRVKDDDWRLSLMMGNFVTLTNVSDAEFERIVKRRASPLYISVHATDPTLRAYLLGAKTNADVMPRLKRLKKEGLSFHAQAVLCPGLNDGDVLDKTISDLAGLYPACRSLALVPVGLTGHRQGLDEIRPFDRWGACDVLDCEKRWQKKLRAEIDTAFVYAADEFYLLADRQFPADERYEDYPQIENGVGLCRMLETEFAQAYEACDITRAKPRRVLSACGVSVAGFMAKLYAEYPVPGVEVSVRAVKNGFFGESVTVSGLVTGGDLVRALRDADADEILITECMLRDGEDVFLDGMPLDEARRNLPCPLTVVGRGGEALLEALTGMPLQWK